MKPISEATCRASGSCVPRGLSSCLPVRSYGCVAARHIQYSPCLAPGSRHLCSSSSSSHQSCRSSVATAASHQDSFTSATSQVQPEQAMQASSSAAVQQQGVPTVMAAAAASQRTMPFAALSRVLLTSSNANVFKTLAQRRQPVSGPMGVLLFLATLIAASFAAIRSLLMKRGKGCKTCRGFGLQRCRLCLGSGRVDWAAKLKHFDVCPLCMNRRFIVCAECGGHYHRPMFAHRRRQAGGAFEPDNSYSGNSAGGFGKDSSGAVQGPIVLNMAAASAAAGGVTVVTSGINMTSGSLNPVLSSMSD